MNQLTLLDLSDDCIAIIFEHLAKTYAGGARYLLICRRISGILNRRFAAAIRCSFIFGSRTYPNHHNLAACLVCMKLQCRTYNTSHPDGSFDCCIINAAIPLMVSAHISKTSEANQSVISRSFQITVGEKVHTLIYNHSRSKYILQEYHCDMRAVEKFMPELYADIEFGV